MPTLSWDGYRFTLDVTFTERDTAKKAGFHWDERKRVWWTGVPIVARIFLNCADWRAKQKFTAEDDIVALSKATDSNIVIPVKDGLAYLGYQKAGIAYALPRPKVLIADEMGLGKTMQAIGVINHETYIKKVLVVCPGSLRINWARELVKWLTRPMTGGFAYEKFFPKDEQICIINYELMKRFRSQIDEHHWDLAIFDESHYLKSFTAQRTQYCFGKWSQNVKVLEPIQADRMICMTGTPILNKPMEIWPTVSVLDPEGLGISEWGFQDRYTNYWESPWGSEYLPKDEMLPDLQHRLRASIMVRRLKKDVLKDLPPKRRQIIALPAEAAKKTVQAEMNFFNENSQLIEDAIQKAEKSQTGDDVSFKEAAEDLKRGKRAFFTELASLRKATGIAKIPYLIEYLEQALEQKEKVVCFAHHTEVIEKVAQHFGKKAVAHHGGIPEPIRQAMRDRFQGTDFTPPDPECSLFMGAITISQGYGLYISDLAVVGEEDWRPGIVSQAEDRLHRYGQKGYVLVQHLVFDGSLDATMVKRTIAKQDMIDASLG